MRILLALCSMAFSSMAFASCPSSVPSGITTCYYADYTNGSDTNAGTSESAPLQHFPGMTGCANNCSNITPAAGEGFILRGGITWPAAALPWNWNYSGTGTTSNPGCTGSGCIYIGVDPTWYAGSAWTRPILNAGGSSGIANQSIFIVGEPGNYWVLDNVEFTGFYWSGTTSYGTANISLHGGEPNVGAHDTIEHVYIHGWSHGTYASGTLEDACGIDGDTEDVNGNTDSIVEYSIVDGSDTDQASCNGAVFGGPPYIAYNEFKYVSSCMVIDGTVTVHDNVCENIDTTFDLTPAHQNGMEINDDGQNATFYNNIFRHIAPGALTIWLAPDGGTTAYFFNNVIYDTQNTNILDLAASLNGATGTDILWNNTVECGIDSGPPDGVCASGIASAVTAVTFQNNHFITNAGSYYNVNSGGPTPTTTTNLLLTYTQATTDGYTSSQTYAFSPTAQNSPTVGAGTSASTLCTASGAGTPCQQSTTYGIAYNTTNHTVSTPGLTPVNLNATPDIGAYQYQASGAGSVSSGVVMSGTVIH